jgi:hypothetical protein
MGAALQVINAFKQGLVGGAFEALAPGTGDSFTVQNVPQQDPAYLAEVWGADSASSYELSVVASRFHDQQFGIRMSGTNSGALAPVRRSTLLSVAGADQRLYPSDVLTVQVNGTAADNVNATLLVYYSNLPGIAARLASWDWVTSMVKNMVGIRVNLTPGAGNWGASVALNATDNRLHADTDYAVLGITSNLPAAAVALSGIDTGNLRVGGPVLADGERDSMLFVQYAQAYNAALIPIINSNNAGAIFLQAAALTNAAIVTDVILAELSQKFVG